LSEFFLDTSAVAKCYLNEVGSAWVRSWANRASGAFLTDKDEFYLTVDIDEAVIVRARNLIAKHPLRTLDAVQLSCALEVINILGVRPTFVAADTRLLAAAAEGLAVDDPGLHS
jgi:predicted nucleic acid-binding protein